MKLIFGRGPSLHLRLLLAIIISVSFIVADTRLDVFSQVRYYLNSFVSPVQYAANLPRNLLDGLYQGFSSRETLQSENKRLKNELLLLKSDALLLTQYKEENNRLRELLGSPYVRDERKMVTEVMAVDSTSYSQQVVIDKGRIDGVYEGQPVINENGIVGQVTFVAAHNSRVLLLSDSNSSIPVQVVRNDIRVIASGNGDLNMLQLEHVPTSTDIQVGDVLLTSGLGGRYPEGYPVATIVSVENDSHRPFALIQAKPEVDLDRLRYLLLVWPSPDQSQQQEAPATQDTQDASTQQLIEAQNQENQASEDAVREAILNAEPDVTEVQVEKPDADQKKTSLEAETNG